MCQRLSSWVFAAVRYGPALKQHDCQLLGGFPLLPALEEGVSWRCQAVVVSAPERGTCDEIQLPLRHLGHSFLRLE